MPGKIVPGNVGNHGAIPVLLRTLLESSDHSSAADCLIAVCLPGVCGSATFYDSTIRRLQQKGAVGEE